MVGKSRITPGSLLMQYISGFIVTWIV